jgi:hypothetical protein
MTTKTQETTTRPSRGWAQATSVETQGKRRTIVATRNGMTTVGIPLPAGGWQYVITLADGRWTLAEAAQRQVAKLQACLDLGLDPVAIMGREAARRAEKGMEA